MPGSVSRGDISSVEKHVAALSQLGEGTISYYCKLCGSTVPLALAHGAIDVELARRIFIVLKTAEKKKDTDDCYF